MLFKRFVAPWLLVADDGVEDGEELSGGCDEGDELGLSGGDEPVTEGLEVGVVLAATMAPRKRAARTSALPPPMKLLPFHFPDWRVQGARPTRAATLRRSRLPSSGSSARRVRAMVLPMPGTEASRSSFSRQAGEPRTRLVDVASPGWRAPSAEPPAAGRCSSAGACWSGAFASGARPRSWRRSAGGGRRDRRAGACRVGQRPDLRLGRLDEVGDDAGVDRIGLGPLAERLCEGCAPAPGSPPPRPSPPQPGSPPPRSRTRRSPRPPQLPGRAAKPGDEGVEPLGVPCDHERLAGRAHRHVQPVLRYVNTNHDGVHPVPSLRKRASLAAQATVRVRWNDGR